LKKKGIFDILSLEMDTLSSLYKSKSKKGDELTRAHESKLKVDQLEEVIKIWDKKEAK